MPDLAARVLGARRRAHNRYRWRLVARLAGVLGTWRLRAAARCYAPGGAGASAAAEDFAERAAGKVSSSTGCP